MCIAYPAKQDRLWGQNLCFHPHIHCIVPAMGCTVNGQMKPIRKQGKYLFPVRQLSVVFKTKLLEEINKKLIHTQSLSSYQTIISNAWQKPWVVFCEPSMGKPQHVIGYLGQYTHRVTISNHRIVDVSQTHVTFKLRDYMDQGKSKTTTLDGVEFLRRFCLHILPKGFFKKGIMAFIVQGSEVQC